MHSYKNLTPNHAARATAMTVGLKSIQEIMDEQARVLGKMKQQIDSLREVA